MSLVVDGLGGGSAGRADMPKHDFDAAVVRTASHSSADIEDRRAIAATRAAASQHVSADAEERRAIAAARATAHTATPVSADAAERRAKADSTAGGACVFVPAAPQTLTVEKNDTIWDYWQDFGDFAQWQPYKNEFREMNAGILADGWLHPGETASLPVEPGTGTWVCEPAPEPAPDPAPASAGAPSPLDLPPYLNPASQAPLALPPYLNPAVPAPATAAANPSCPPDFYSPSADPEADAALWNKQAAFAVRALPRMLLEGLMGTGAPTGIAGGLNSASKVGGLGAFALFNTMQKVNEIEGYWEAGDEGRAVAATTELLNGLRIGLTGINPVLGSPWIANTMGGPAGQKLGIGANIAAAVAKTYSNVEHYQQQMACADTPRKQDIAAYDFYDAQLSTLFDTANDIVPYLGANGKDKPINWGVWAAGKALDHWAQDQLEGTAYKPRSIGADHVRNLMPLFAAAGGIPTVEHYDLATARSADERIVMDEANSVHKAAGIYAGVGDIAVTTTEVALAGYYGRKPEVVYGVLQLDHAIRQGLNVWTGDDWQTPQERAGAVTDAGLDPALDPHRVEYEQEDFVHRTAASMMSDVNIARLKAKDYAGGASAEEKRYIEIYEQFENADIDGATDGRGSNSGFFSPHNAWEITKLGIPGGQALEQVPAGVGYTIGWVQGGGIGNTVDAVGDFAADTAKGVGGFVSDAGRGLLGAFGIGN